MITTILNIKNLIAKTVLLFGVVSVFAQVGHLPVWPPPENFLLPSHLGSSRMAMELWSPDLNELVELAMPIYDSGNLWLLLKKIEAKYQDAGPGGNFNPQSLSQLFLFEVKEGQGQTGKGAYSINSQKGEALITKDLFSSVFQSEQRAKQMMKEIHNQHLEVLARMGIGVDQIYSLNLHFRNIELAKDLGNGRMASVDVPLVEGFVTYVTRAIEGIIIDGSEIKILSQDDQALAGLTVRWPRFAFHPEMRDLTIRDKQSLEDEILIKARAKLAEHKQYNVKIAVVFRPVQYQGKNYFTPALKVGVFSRPLGTLPSEATGEAGDKFYVSLLKQTLPEDNLDRVDVREINDR